MACAVIMRVRCPGLPCEATGASVCCEHVSAGFGIPACATGRMGTRGAARKLGCSGRQTGTMLISCMSGYCSSSPGEIGRSCSLAASEAGRQIPVNSMAPPLPFLFFSFLFVGLMITDHSCFQMGKRTGTGVEKSLDKCFVKAWVMRKIWTNPIGIPAFLEISSYKQLLLLLSRSGLWGNLSELR